jgi:acetate kinase
MASGVLIVNGGSSSVKFALYRVGPPLERAVSGTFERIGAGDGRLTVRGAGGGTERQLSLADHAACVPVLHQELAMAALSIDAIGHRVVHGGSRFVAPERITPAVVAELRKLAVLAPEHEAAEIALIEACDRAYPGVPQVACFDTAFHAQLPRVAQLLPIPLRYAAHGVRRYGFHGISYEYLLQELGRIGAAGGRIILAHLGNGASLAAVRDGRCIDTTMAFTPAAGLVMGTRAGDLDPGLAAYFARAEGYDAARFDRMVNAESGLLGLSESSADVRDLQSSAAGGDRRAADALAVFCYQARKWIGALTAALGGLDALVFAGGIGEHGAALRADICGELAHLGVVLDAQRNADNAALISADGAAVSVRVIPTDEELMIARATVACLKISPQRAQRSGE